MPKQAIFETDKGTITIELYDGLVHERDRKAH